MGRGVVECLVGRPNNPPKIHRRNSIFTDIWRGSGDTNWNKLVQCLGLKIFPCWKWGANGKAVKHVRRYWESATIRLAKYQQKLSRWYNKDVKSREFSAGDLVLRKALGNARDANAGKLFPNWEGPYMVTIIARAGAYYLEDMDERPLPCQWNVQNLRRFYHWL